MKCIVDGLAIEYKDEGQGPVVLLLHGWGNTMNSFDVLCRHLTGFRMVRVDAPGFGLSETPHEGWNVERYARFISAFCEKIGIETVIIVGHSFGGRIATKGVSRGILSPEKIVLIASAGVAQRRTARNAFYAAIAKVGKIVFSPLPTRTYERLRHVLYARTGSDYLTTRTEIMQQTFLNMLQEDLSDDASMIAIPVLLIWGKNDVVTPLSEGEKLHSLIPGSTLRVIPATGHFVHQEKPEEVARLIREFV